MRIGIIAVFGLLGWTLWASDGGSLLGTVTDPKGAAIPGASVTATETATAVKQTIATDGSGFYSFQTLPVGRYDVEVRASGFQPLRRTGVIDRCRQQGCGGCVSRHRREERQGDRFRIGRAGRHRRYPNG